MSHPHDRETSERPSRPRRATRLVTRTVRYALRVIGYGLVGAFLVVIVGAVVFLDRRPDLSIWHTATLDAEFTREAGLTSFDEYLALEERLFKQLDERVYAAVPTGDDLAINRYQRGSVSDPGRWSTNWNRSFELTAPSPRAGVLLVHGMSDSPYSMRSLAEVLHDDGATVLALRVPGHGAAPSGLLRVEWEDMLAAVELAMHHLRDQVGDAPLYMVGYSNGGGLAVRYALSTLDDTALPPAAGLVLISPEIGITKAAALAIWQERLGRLVGLEKLAWNSISLEYDPFKYESFAVNAGNQAYRLTKEIGDRMADAADRGALDRFPPVLAFQSVVDATVLPEALVSTLFEQLPPGGHELVLFDVNRRIARMHMLKRGPMDALDRLCAMPDLSFTLSVVTNESDERLDAVVRRRAVGAGSFKESPLGLQWPRDIYSLAHIALPFPPDDAVYGGPEAAPSPGIQIGNLVARGERGVSLVPPGSLLRVHWNPFHPYMTQRVLGFARGDASHE